MTQHLAAAPVTTRDPVCGMDVDPGAAATTRQHMGQTFYFCSEDCAKKFDADPHAYAHEPAAATVSAQATPLAGSLTTGFNPALPGAWSALQHRSANMNTLIATGTGAAWLYSTVAVLFPSIFPAGTAEPFYDVVAVVIALVVLGQAESATRRRGDGFLERDSGQQREPAARIPAAL